MISQINALKPKGENSGFTRTEVCRNDASRMEAHMRSPRHLNAKEREAHKEYLDKLFAITVEAANSGTIEEVAERTGISERQVYALRRGKTLPQVVTFLYLLKGRLDLYERAEQAAAAYHAQLMKIRFPRGRGSG
jgi:hypothetical protein